MKEPVKVLVIDDEEAIRRNFRSCLEDLEYQVMEAGDGREGLAVFSRDPADIVLTDLRMPGMGGLEFIAGLKQRSPGTPVVAVSGTGTLPDAVEAIRQGAWDYLVKPVSEAGELDVIIRRNLERANLLAENRGYREHLEEMVGQRTRELRESEAKLSDILNSVPQSIFWKDRNGVYLGCNEVFARAVDLGRPEEVVGKRDKDFPWPQEEADVYRADDRKVMETKQPKRHIVEPLQRSDGTRLWIDTTKVPLLDEDGNAYGVLGVYEDITERKRAEEEIRRLNEELERRVKDRTAKLEVINKELEAFSYSVSHDLRAPLRSIDGFSHVLEENYGDKLNDEGKEYLSRVRKGCQRMAEIIDDLLNLSRITRIELSPSTVDLGVLARDIVATLQAGEPQRRVEVVIAEGLKVVADESLMQIVLENLLGNAWKFTRKQPQAKIELGVIHQEGKIVYFVRDNGAGFDMLYADKLFGAFQRFHSKDEFEGTGIGLAIVQRIITRHGGRIWAEAKINEGATFYFTIS